MDEDCPSHCENTTIEEVEGRLIYGCLDCGSATVFFTRWTPSQ